MNATRRILYFFPALFYYGIIFLLSSQSSFPVKEPFGNFDKIIHVAEFAVLGFFLTYGYVKSFKFSWLLKAILVFLTGLGLGLLDEFHQSFVPGRNRDLWDAVTDAVGIAVGILVFRLIFKKVRRRFPGNSLIR